MKSIPNISLFFLKYFEEYLRKLWSIIEKLRVDLAEKNEKLEKAEAEIRRLKELPKKPKIKASCLDEPSSDAPKEEKKKRGGSVKRKKKDTLKIDEVQQIKVEDVPLGWKLKGYKSCIIQDLIIRSNNVEYQLEIWQSPNGKQCMTARLPVALQNTHFGPTLKAYILHQYNECGVTQPLILSSLRDFGVDISAGMINNILVEKKEVFHTEKLALLAKAIELKQELRTDDTGARHAFKNGYCNCINSDLFTYFTTSHSKSRINFLEILNSQRGTYELNEAALAYAKEEGLGDKYYTVLLQSYEDGLQHFPNKQSLNAYFDLHKFTAVYALKIMTQALLIGSLIEHGFDPNTLIHSDGAGQFNVFLHSLCWKHAERPLVKLIASTPTQQKELDDKRAAFWSIYQDLKKYKQQPNTLERKFFNILAAGLRHCL